MKKNILTAILFAQVLFISCGESKELTDNESSASEITAVASEHEAAIQGKSDEPEEVNNQSGSSITEAIGDVTEVLGDLDKDGVDEKVIVSDTSKEGDFGIERKISIYKFANDSWHLWHESQGAVLPSKHGGGMGEPFDGITIENGCIVIRHSGGSRSKWSYTHRYRYQNNNWFLIGATISFGEAACAWDTFDYNMLTGKLEVEKYRTTCDGEDIGEEIIDKYAATIKIENLPLMDNFYPGDNEVKISEHSDVFYY